MANTAKKPVAEVLDMLAATPVRIAEATAGLTAAQLRTAPRADEWSAVAILAHLRACADMWGGAIEAILVEGLTTIRAINPRTWIDRTDYRELEFAPSLAAFTEQRARLLARLEPLPAEGWAREVIVTGAGAPIVRTVHGFAHRLAVHERPHLAQIARLAQSVRDG